MQPVRARESKGDDVLASGLLGKVLLGGSAVVALFGVALAQDDVDLPRAPQPYTGSARPQGLITTPPTATYATPAEADAANLRMAVTSRDPRSLSGCNSLAE